MPEYVVSSFGEYENEQLHIPSSFPHMNQVLFHMKDEHWKHCQDAASKLLQGEITLPHKIKPSVKINS